MSGEAPDPALARDYAECGRLARAGDHDRWLAALFAPERLRPHLHAIAAFGYETGRIGLRVREPLAGEMRLAWWREALSGMRPGEAAGNPVAAALADTIAKFKLPLAAFDDLLQALTFDVYDDAPASLAELEAYGRATSGALIAFAARVLGHEGEGAVVEASAEAGAGLALARALFEFAGAQDAKRLPRDMRDSAGTAQIAELAEARLAAAEARLSMAPGQLAPAFAPVATARLDLARWRRGGLRPFAPAAPWRRQLALWLWLRRR